MTISFETLKEWAEIMNHPTKLLDTPQETHRQIRAAIDSREIAQRVSGGHVLFPKYKWVAIPPQELNELASIWGE